MSIPLVALMGRENDSATQFSGGVLNGLAARKMEAEAGAAADARKTQVFQQIGGALKGLQGLAPEEQAAGFDRIKTLALRTWGDNPEIASQIEPLTPANLPDLYSMFTTYEDQMKTQGQMAKDDATVRYTDAGTSLRGAQEGDITVDNRRADWKTGADVANINSQIGDRAQRTALYGSSVASGNLSREEATRLAREKALRTGYGNVGDGQLVDPGTGVAAPIPGYVAPVTGKPAAGKVRELPAALKKTEDQDAVAVDTADSIAADAAQIAQQLETGQIDPGAVTGAQTWLARNTGIGSTESTDAVERLNRFRTRFVNEGLRLNSGPQTEGDAQRALNELQYAKDPRSAAKAVRELEKIMRRNSELKRKQMNDRRARNGVEPLQFDNAPATSIYGDGPAPAAPPSSGLQPGAIEDGYRFNGGDPADPNNWEPVQ